MMDAVVNPSIGPRLKRDISLIARSGLFDAAWYVSRYGITAADPILHFLQDGAREGHDPNPLFDTRFYLLTNPDVAAAGVNPLIHFLRFGMAEGRSPSCRSLPAAKLLPGAWCPVDCDVEVDDSGVMVIPLGKDGPVAGQGITTCQVYRDITLGFEVLLDDCQIFIAKVRSGAPFDQSANSYHLVVGETGGYLARHDHVLAQFSIDRRGWRVIELAVTDVTLTVRIDRISVATAQDDTLHDGTCFLGGSGGEIRLRNIRLKAEPILIAERTNAAPAGWCWTASGAARENETLVFAPAGSGNAVGLVSGMALTEAMLSAEIKLSSDAAFIAKLHAERAEDPAANSYHLVASRSGDYLAKHHRVFAPVKLPRNRWFALSLRRPDHIELTVTVDNQVVATVQDYQLQSGFAEVMATAGRIEMRGLMFGPAQNGPLPDNQPLEPPRLAHGPAARQGGRLPCLPFTRMPRRNLIYHVWPVHGAPWRQNLEELKKRIDIFNGKRIIASVHDDRSEPAEAVQAELEGHGCRFIECPNGPEGEALTFPRLLCEVKSTDPDEITFYGHAKGVRHGPEMPTPIRKWTEALYRVNLDNWQAVRQAMVGHAVAGAFRMLGRFKAHHNMAPWHFGGTFFWLRHAHVFNRPRLDIPQFYGGVETWPGLHFAREETMCLSLDSLRQLPYAADFWSTIGDPAISAWERARQQIPVPADLATPPPFAGHALPRLEQKTGEFDWFLSRMLAADVHRVLTIGAMHGGVEWHLARVFREAGRSIDITVVELSPGEDAQRSFHQIAEQFGQTVRLIAGDSSAEETQRQLDRAYDAVFIDGDHSYRGAAADWRLALTRHPRLVALHDIADSDWHITAHCCVSRLWDELRRDYRTEERIEGVWGGIGIVWL